MKILFFLVLLANLTLLMWEYRTGAFAPPHNQEDSTAESTLEPILLLEEANKLAASRQPTVVEPPKPTPTQTPIADASTAPISTNPTEAIVPAAPSTAPVASAITTPAPSIAPIAETPPKPIADTAIATAQSEPEATPSTDNAAIPIVSNQCYEAGPFANKQAYQAWVKNLKETPTEIKIISHDEQIPSKYMVYYPAAATETESKANIELLKSQGIKDLWPLSGSDYGAISLGLFVKEATAIVMQNELLAKGIHAEIKTLYKTKPQQWVWLKGTTELAERLVNLQQAYPQVQVNPLHDPSQNCQ